MNNANSSTTPALISIYLPTHNRLGLLQRAIESVRQQSHPHWELMVVVDNSSDGTAAYLESIADPRVKTIVNKVSMGACISRNLAIANASGEYITGLDDDDYFLPDRLTDFHENWCRLTSAGVEFGFLYDDAVVLGQDGGQAMRRFVKVADQRRLNGYNCVGSQVFCRRTDIISAGGFSPSMPAWQDWDMWVRLQRLSGKGINIRKANYVVDESHDHERISQKPAHVLRYAAEQFLYRNKQLNAAERASVRYTLSKYPQVGRTLADCLRILPIMSSNPLFWEKLERKAADLVTRHGH
ncbi:glycosyltransferase [Stenotrophomonas sp.]|uniref:glycosyltransferase n=1 Tax=Stenotrophomonas sp. TaxID=69392 RepID=UPI0028AD8760|nr:glycosyltransferase [Stenotrophomonas sp.]